MADVVRALCVSSVVLSEWVDVYKAKGADGLVNDSAVICKDAEHRRLLKERERLLIENEIVRKSLHVLDKKPGERAAFVG